MENISTKYNRHSLRLTNYDYSNKGLYFITICVENCVSLFGEVFDGELKLNLFGEIAKEEWLRTDQIRDNVQLHEFIIMPNHIHILLILDDINVEGTQYSNRLGVFVSSLKRFTNKKFGRDLWQRSYYDNIIRDEEIFLKYGNISIIILFNGFWIAISTRLLSHPQGDAYP